MRTILALIYASSASLCVNSVLAYDANTHFDLSRAAAQNSETFQFPDFLRKVGLDTLPSSQTFPSSPPTAFADGPDLAKLGCAHGELFAPIVLIACGAGFEDYPLTRVINHFYDPINNAPLTIDGTPPGSVIGVPNLTSPDWALQDVANLEPVQTFAYRDARDYFYRALTTPGLQSTRDPYWGMLFQAIGQVTHHLEDMAQPQHVRNDAHLSLPIPGFYNPSVYEQYTSDNERSLQNIIFGSIAPAYSPASPGPFNVARDFWKNASGTGIAEYTNSNFFSAGTNVKLNHGQPVVNANYSSPVPEMNETDVQITELVSGPTYQDILTYCGASPVCAMTFYSTNGPDVVNPRAAAVSIFDQDVRLRPVQYDEPFVYQVDRIPTLNRFTFDSAHPLLLPQAVSYAAGLIDYFFRGELEINVSEEGVYALADHGRAEVNAKGTGGFSTIKARVRNVTPNQSMDSAGTLRAVVKFHRNDCYGPDLSGEYDVNAPYTGPAYPADGCDVAPCPAAIEMAPNFTVSSADCPSSGALTQTGAEEIVVSNEVAVTSAIDSTDSTGGQVAVFTFPQRIPINARDVHLQVVYRGPLGQESDAVVVGTRDVSEPSYYTIANMTDYVMCVNGTFYRNNADGSISDPEKNAILAAGGNAQDFSNPHYLPQTNDKIVVAIEPPYNYDGSNPPFVSFNPVAVDSNMKVVASKDYLAPGEYLRLAFLTDRGISSDHNSVNPFEVAAADLAIDSGFHWYFWNVWNPWFSVNQRSESENTASGTFRFRDLRTTNNWYMTYKTYFRNTNCLATGLGTIDQSSPSPSRLVPFTSFSFGT